MSDLAIRVEGLSKRYRIGARRRSYQTLRDRLTDAITFPFRRLHSNYQPPSLQPADENAIWALKDVSFDVKHGEVVGVIGRNGAGKSTLLKVLSRITGPTEGRVEVFGRVGSLLEVGTGFHPELTGRDNIYLNGAILGMRKAEIDARFDEIVAFAEVGKFIDTPVKHYSSGMYVRLAFAVAAHLEPEILLVDEVLAVGDIAFQKKCLGKMTQIAQGGRTVVFVSHNMAAILGLCDIAMLIDGGRRQLLADPGSVVKKYLQEAAGRAEVRWTDEQTMPGDDTIQLHAVRIRNCAGEVVDTIDMEAGFWVEIEYEIRKPVRGLQLGFRMTAAEGTVVLTSGDTDNHPNGTLERHPGQYLSRCAMPGGLLSAQTYFFSFGAHVPNIQTHYFVESALSVSVVRTQPMGSIADDRRQGVICPVLPWDVSSHQGAVT